MPFTKPLGPQVTAPISTRRAPPSVANRVAAMPATVTNQPVRRRVLPAPSAGSRAEAPAATSRRQGAGTLSERMRRIGVQVLPLDVGPVTHAAMPWDYAKPMVVGGPPYVPTPLCAENRLLHWSDFPFPPCHGAPCAHEQIDTRDAYLLTDPLFNHGMSTPYRLGLPTPQAAPGMTARIQAEMAEQRQRERDAPCNRHLRQAMPWVRLPD